jgi:MFS family permease
MIGMGTIIQSLPRLNLVSLQNSHSSFIVAFGITKAVSNYFAGKLANRYGRKNLLFLDGFCLAYPFILIQPHGIGFLQIFC